MATKGRNLILSLFCFFVFIGCCPSYSQTDTLLQGQQLRDGDSLVSSFDICKLGFFNYKTSQAQNHYYLGIWYNKTDEKAVWVANPDTPLFDNSAVLILDTDGWLKISNNGSNTTITLNSIRATGNASATLQKDCNFVLNELSSNGSTKQVLWQSFDHPTDTLLPGMKLGFDLKTGRTWSLRSWVSDDLPGIGSFTLGMNPNDSTQLIIWLQEKIYWRSGHWYNGSFSSINALSALYDFDFVSNATLSYFTYRLDNDFTVFPKLTMTSMGELRAYNYIDSLYERYIQIRRKYECLVVSCDDRSNHDCLWETHFAQAGCVSQELPECWNTTEMYFYHRPREWLISGDGFKLGKSENLTLMDCKAECLNNCSCVAYASSNDNCTGCEFWSSLPQFRDNYYNTSVDYSRFIYVRWKFVDPHVANNWWKCLLKAVGGAQGILLLCTICYFIWRKHREILQLLRSLHDSMWQKLRAAAENKVNQMLSYELGHDIAEDEKDRKTREWKLFSFSSIVTATDNFSHANKLGEGGFGPVYKGKLVEGQEVAIKRLSRSSGQGVVEFKNEITLIAKLQHTNLVRLLGCCIRGEEKILIYEYMPNKSLDSFLFDPSKKNLLNWGKRLFIIEGIAQGLIYLHKYSRLRIIHRDLKASNILLDNEMNPKISDFGLARIFELHESEANTNRIVGTYGYMSPEYAMQGIVSTKIDVFSFGVLLLEIVSGKKNNSFYHYERPLNLVGFAWELWKEDRAMELVDPTLIETCPSSEVLRCIHVGLLCVQDHAEDRPNMTDVVAMLSNETVQLCAPKQPAFLIKVDGHIAKIAENKCDKFSLCQVSISEMEAR